MEFGTYKLTYQFNQNNKLAHYLQVRRKLQPHRGASSTSYSDAQGAYVQDQIGIGKRVTVNAGLRWDYYTVSYPEETINEGRFRDFFYAGAPLPNGYAIPASYPSFEVPARDDMITYRAASGPRFGVAWDVQGNGKTVLKTNWGRYYYNPGAQDAVNPVQSISYVFAWRDVNVDRQFTLSEVGSFVSSSGGVRNTIDPDIGHPYTDDMSVWLERELVPNLSGRVGFVYKRQQNGYQSIEVARVGSLFTGVVSAYDPGPDGIRGNEDDKGAFTMYDIPAGVPVPASFTDLRTPDDNDADYKSIDLTLNKRMTGRWSLVSSFMYTWNHNLLFGHPQNPNEELSNEYRTTDWAFKVFGTYRAPWGVVVSPILRHQGGDPQRRIVQVTGLRVGTFNYTAEPMGAYREDNVTIFDARLEKVFKLPDRREVTLFFDAFNLLNSNAAQDQDNITGRRTLTLEGERVEYQRFLRPTTIIGPRVYRLGFKLVF